MLEQVVEIVALHDHVVELKEAQSPLHALLVALGAQHVVHGEAGANLSQQLNIIEIQQPVGVIHHQSLIRPELNEFFHLPAEALGVVVNVLPGQHLAHIGAAGGIADHGGAAADKGDGAVARLLQALHQRQRHEMAGGQAVRRAVKANVEGGLAGIHHLADFFLVGHLCNEPAGDQFLINTHCDFLPYLIICSFESILLRALLPRRSGRRRVRRFASDPDSAYTRIFPQNPG